MHVFRDISIKQKLVRISLFTSGLALILSGLFLTINEVAVFKESLLNELTTQTEIIGSNCTAALAFNDAKAAKEILSAVRANRHIDIALIYAKDGALFADYTREGKKHNVPRLLQKEGHRFSLTDVTVYHDIVLDNEVVGSIYIHSNLQALYTNLVRYAGIFLAAFLLSMCLVYVLSFNLQKSITGPVSGLVHTMNIVSEEKDYSLRAAVQSKDEMGSLAEGFNEMITRIQRELTEREKAEKEVHRLNEELEMQVKERTRQLIDAQEELVRKEKLVTLGQLSASVGHELRNPLGVISNAVYFLQTVMPEADETVSEYLDIIKSEVNNSQRIITDLLDITRTKMPQTELITVDELVRQGLEKCTVPAKVTLRVKIPDTLPALQVDPLQLGQVIQNLVTNAVQAMPVGGEVRISARFVGAGLAPAQSGYPQGAPLQDFIEISVADTGEGISPENMKRLFQPLFTTKARGIGLGLIVSKNLVEANGGRIEVKSELEKGTTFIVALPVNGDNIQLLNIKQRGPAVFGDTAHLHKVRG